LKEELEYLDKRRSLTIKRQKQESSIRKVQISQLQESANMLQQNLSFARQNLKDLLITAPVSGYLSNFDVDIGENKRVGERLGQIDIPDEYKVVVNVDEYYLNKVALNATANVSINGKIIASQIYKIDSRVINSQFQVDISLPQNIDSIKIGQTLNVDMFLGETIPNTLLIKQGSFYSTTGGHWVFVVDKEHDLAERRSIKLGRKNQEYYEVLAGLNEGEEVLISSYETFEQAKTVRLK
jgi:HlyD family secretion protein